MTILHQHGHEIDGLFVVDDEVTWAVPNTDTSPSPTVVWTMPVDAIVSTVKAFEAVELLVGHLDMGANVGLQTAIEALHGCLTAMVEAGLVEPDSERAGEYSW
jgi:hypothetical protein